MIHARNAQRKPLYGSISMRGFFYEMHACGFSQPDSDRRRFDDQSSQKRTGSYYAPKARQSHYDPLDSQGSRWSQAGGRSAWSSTSYIAPSTYQIHRSENCKVGRGEVNQAQREAFFTGWPPATRNTKRPRCVAPTKQHAKRSLRNQRNGLYAICHLSAM